jgi:hypothetical protein
VEGAFETELRASSELKWVSLSRNLDFVTRMSLLGCLALNDDKSRRPITRCLMQVIATKRYLGTVRTILDAEASR